MLDKKHKLSEHIQFPDKFHIEINNRNNGILEELHIENTKPALGKSFSLAGSRMFNL